MVRLAPVRGPGSRLSCIVTRTLRGSNCGADEFAGGCSAGAESFFRLAGGDAFVRRSLQRQSGGGGLGRAPVGPDPRCSGRHSSDDFGRGPEDRPFTHGVSRTFRTVGQIGRTWALRERPDRSLEVAL